MISSETPYKLAEILRETWPGIYKKPHSHKNETEISSSITTTTSNNILQTRN